MLTKKQLQITLSNLQPLSSLNSSLEQYQLEGNLAAEILWHALINEDIEGKVIADLGCGNGILGIAALSLGAKNVYFLDIDKKAITIAKENALGKGIYLNEDVSKFNVKVDTVLMNPPFGVQQRKADKPFLEKAMYCANVIYSLHKIESKNFIAQLAKEHNYTVERIIPTSFDIKKTYSFHKKKKHRVEIGIWILRLSRK
ncbi:MAG: METTL5 family protein [Candidatus Nanoarchaeia archaeon]